MSTPHSERIIILRHPVISASRLPTSGLTVQDSPGNFPEDTAALRRAADRTIPARLSSPWKGSNLFSTKAPENRKSKYGSIVTALFFLSLFCGCGGKEAIRGNRTIVIGLDGGTWNILAPLIREGSLPNFHRLVEEGVYGNLLVDPPYSPPSWTSLATGKSPANHGVEEFVHRSYPDSASPIYTLAPTRGGDVSTKRIWNILNDNGLTTGVCYWLFTWPLEMIDGLMISDYRGNAFDGLKERNLQTDVFHAFNRRRWLDKSLRMTGNEAEKLDEAAMNPRFAVRDKLVNDAFLKAEQKFSTARHILKEYPELDFFSISFYWGNDLQHKFLHYAVNPEYYGTPEAEIERYKDVIPMFYRNMDEFLGELLDDPATKTLAIISDHGMELIRRDAETNLGCYHFIINFERILDELGFRFVDPVTGKTDWSRTKAYPCLYRRTEFGIALNLQGREEHGIIPAGSARLVADSLRQDLSRVRFADTGRPLWDQVNPSGEEWPDLVFENYYSFNYGDIGKLLFSEILVGETAVPAKEIIGYPGYLTRGEHGYDFDGIKPYAEYGVIFLHGPQFKRGRKIEDRSFRSVDFVPTLLYALDLPVGEDMDGDVKLDAFKSSFTSGNPVRTLPTCDDAGRERRFLSEPETDRTFDETEVERLRALGYIQ